MRNLLQHPLQADETVRVLRDAVDKELASGRIGGISALALGYVAEFIDGNPDFARFLEAKALRMNTPDTFS